MASVMTWIAKVIGVVRIAHACKSNMIGMGYNVFKSKTRKYYFVAFGEEWN